jgi:anti-sigma factor RsiW
MSVSCEIFLEELSPFLDGELEEATLSQLAEHMHACPDCKAEYDALKSLRELLVTDAETAAQRCGDLWAAIADRLPDVCSTVKDDFSAYLDGELIPPAQEGVAAHLQECPACLAEFQELSSVNAMVARGLQLPETIPVDLWTGVKSRLNDDCTLIRQELSAFLDREVATLRHRAITAHLFECPACKEEFCGLSAAGEVLRTHYQPSLPDDFDLWPEVQAAMKIVPFEAREHPRERISYRRLHVVAAAVAGGILVAGFLFLRGHFESQSVPPVTAENYLIDASMGEPANVAEAVVYEHQ